MPSRIRYLVSYDIADPRRLRRVAKICESFGHRIQFSVFECALDPLGRAKMENLLHQALHHEEDQVLFVRLGNLESEMGTKIESIGLPYTQQPRVLVI